MDAPCSGLGTRPKLNSGDSGGFQCADDLDLLVRRARAGDLRAQGELVFRYRPRLAGFLRQRVRPAHEVEDLLQVVWTKMTGRIRDLRDPRLFESWLFTLARNTSLDHARRYRVRPADGTGEPLPTELPTENHPERSAEIREGLEVALRRFGARERRLMEQLIEGESYEAIAEREGLGLNALKVRIHRLRHALRASMIEADIPARPASR